jgi:hypothetical protein
LALSAFPEKKSLLNPFPGYRDMGIEQQRVWEQILAEHTPVGRYPEFKFGRKGKEMVEVKVIAEIGCNHKGDMDIAKELI